MCHALLGTLARFQRVLMFVLSDDRFQRSMLMSDSQVPNVGFFDPANLRAFARIFNFLKSPYNFRKSFLPLYKVLPHVNFVYQPSRFSLLFWRKKAFLLLTTSHLKNAVMRLQNGPEIDRFAGKQRFAGRDGIQHETEPGSFHNHCSGGRHLAIMIRLFRKLRKTFLSLPLGKVPPPTWKTTL